MCCKEFSTIGEIKRQQAEISRISKKLQDERQKKKEENEINYSK